MSFSISYEDDDAREILKALSDRVKNLTPVMQGVGEYLLFVHDRRFEEEVDYRGEPLQPNTPFTLAQKRAKGQILKTLQATGLMRARTTYQITDDGNSVRLVNSDRKAVKHQLGIGVPKREIFGIGQKEREDILEIFRNA